MKKELTILIAWHKEANEDRIKCFEENKKTIEENNPDATVIVVMSPFENNTNAWLSTDLTLFYWYNDNINNIESERFLLLEWDCWCDLDLKEYYSRVWDLDVVGPCLKYPERDSWYWFQSINKLPERARLYASGIVPFCGILISEKAMKSICNEILHPDYAGLNSELRFPTIAAMLGFDPVPNPVCSRSITWKSNIHSNARPKGLHHPRKTLTVGNVLNKIEKFLGAETDTLPRILHQTWKNSSPDNYMDMLAQTWKDKHPDWEYILWTDEMNYEFIKKFFPEFLLKYESYPNNIQRVDAVRYFILYKLGGLFIDLDFECIENVEALLLDVECAFGLEPQEHCDQFKKDKIICNAFMASKPQNHFFYTICNSLSSLIANNSNYLNSVLATTGPFALTEIYNNYKFKGKIKLLASETIYPLTVKETRRALNNDIDQKMQKKIDNAYAVHYFLGSWYKKIS